LQDPQAGLRSWRLGGPARATSRRVHEGIVPKASAVFAVRPGSVGCDPREYLLTPVTTIADRARNWPSVLDK